MSDYPASEPQFVHQELSTDVDESTTILGKPLETLILGYLSCPRDGNEAYLGAVLVTDYRTRPTEFRFVRPVRPSKLQRILFGRTLDEHVSIDVIGRQLLKGIERTPDLLLVDEKELVAIRKSVDFPVVWIPNEDGGPVTDGSPTLPSYVVAEDSNDADEVGPAIEQLRAATLLLDPFDRIAEAFKLSPNAEQ